MKELNEQALERKATPKASPLAPEQSSAATGSRKALDPGQADAGLPQPPANAAKRKSGLAVRRGRLDREVLAKLGKGLKDCFADVQNQEVPERFKTLLQQF